MLLPPSGGSQELPDESFIIHPLNGVDLCAQM